MIFHWGRYFGQFFQWGGGPTGSVRRGCNYKFPFVFLVVVSKFKTAVDKEDFTIRVYTLAPKIE